MAEEDASERDPAPAASEEPDKESGVTSGTDDEPVKSFDQSMINTVVNAFLAPQFSHAVFGLQNTPTTALTRSTGRVDEDEVVALLGHFVEPECFTGGAVRLGHDRVVVLYGPAGTGKRSSALSLLRQLTEKDLYMLSPQVPLAGLAEYDYAPGCGYLVIDRVVEHGATESDFDWGLVRDRLADQKAFLVVTTSLNGTVKGESVCHLAWSPPPPQRVLRSYWPEEWPEEHVETLRGVLDSIDRVSDVVDLARRLNGGESPEIAVTHFDARIREKVFEWFEAPPDRRKILEVTTLAYALGVDERNFEAALSLLRRVLHEHMPEPIGDETASAEDHLPQLRGQLAANELVTTTRLPTELGTRSALVFAQPGYHRHVLAQLWQRMDVSFWDAVRDWLGLLVMRPQYEQAVAIGLSELADVALDEVLPVLDAWARGRRGTAGQRAAVYVLWRMAYQDSLAPTALQIATKWITRGEATHRWVAAMTFSGQLGVRYPHDAVSRLWQLCVQSHTADGDVEMVFGELFSTLVRETTDAGIVLSVMAGKVDRFTRPGAKPRMGAVAVRTVLAALAVKDPLTKRVSVLTYLAEFPERTDVVARLLAAVLVHRPVRLRAIRTLRALLEDLAKNAERAEEQARALGEALAAQLAPDERVALEAEFRVVVTHRGNDIGPLVATLLKALSGLIVTK